MLIRRQSRLLAPSKADNPTVVLCSADPLLVSRLEGLRFRLLSIPLDGPVPRTVGAANVLLLDTRGADLTALRKIREDPLFARHVTAVLTEDESLLAEHQRLVRADDAELRELDVPVLARRIRSWTVVAEGRESHSLLTRALDASVNGVCIADARVPGFPIRYVSSTFERMTGYTASECIGKSCRFLQTPETSVDALGVLREALAAGTRATVVLLNMRKDGTRFWNELTVFPLRDEHGAIESMLGVQHDVSQLVTAQLLHRSTEERVSFMAALLDEVDALLTTDGAARVTFANRAAEDLLRCPLDRILGADAVELLGLPAGAAAAIRGNGVRAFEATYELSAADASVVPVELTVRAASGDSAAWVITLRDAARRAYLANEREQTRRLVALGSMLSGLAHEIRNPLATMSLLLGEVTESSDPAAAAAAVKIRRQLDRVTRIVRDTSSFARPHPPQRRTTAVNTLLDQAVDALRSRLLSGSIAFDSERAADDASVYADEKQVVQVLVAVVGNAIEAARTRVLVRVEAESGRTTFLIVDDGPGIEESHRARIFDPFFTTKSMGTGLGLAIATRLAEAHGGSLTLRETSPRGSTFALTLSTEPSAP